MRHRRHRVPIVALLAVLALAGACREEQAADVPERLPEALAEDLLPALPKLTLERGLGTVETAGGPVLLTTKVSAGAAWSQHVTLHQALRHGGPDVPRGESEIDQHLVVRYEGAADGRRVLARVEQARVRMTPDLSGVVAGAEQSLRGLAWSFEQDERGRVSAVSLGTPAQPAAEGASPLAAVRAALEQVSLELPAEPVTPGASWDVERALLLPLTAATSVPAQVSTHATFRGVATRDSRRLAVIELELRQRLRGTLAAEGAPAEVVGAALGRGLILFDLDRGRATRSELVLNGRQELLVATADGRRFLVQEQALRLVTEETAPATPAP
jgi:hypothetical protein